MNTKFTKTVAVTGLTVSAFVAVCGFTNTAFADEAPAVVNTPVENPAPAPGSFRARLLKNQAVLNALNEKKNDKALELIKAIKEESKKATQEANQPQAENKKAEEDRTADDQTAKENQTAEDKKLDPVDDSAVKGVAVLGLKTLEEYEAALSKKNQGLTEEQRTLYRKTLKTKIETLEKTYSEALDYAETIVRYNVQDADESLKAAAKEFLKNRDNFKSKSFADSDLTTINQVWASSDEFNKKITPSLKSAIAQAKKKASEAAQGGTAGSHVESPAPASPSAPAYPQAPNPADSEKNEAPSSQDAPSAGAPSADAPSASAPSAGSSSAGAPSEDEISDLDIEDDWLKEISDYLESPEFDDLMKSYNFDNSNSDNSNSDNSNSDDFNLDDFNLDDFNFDDFNLDDFDLSDFNLDDFDFSDIDLNA